MNPTTNRRNSDDYSRQAIASALEPSQRHRKRAESGGSDEPYPVDHDDLLALLERPRPQHGDLRALLRRTSTMGQAALSEKTRKQADIGISISGAQDAR
jgi:hypothetical protein